MPIYPDNSANHPDQGMTHADMQAVARVAAQRNEIIMFRDTGCWSRPYIEAGHPTKPFHVKDKSSDWGPHAGLVPYNSEFSKAFSQGAIDKGFTLNKDAIKGNFARPVPAFVTEEFIRSELLVNKGSGNRPPVDRITQPRADVTYFFCTKPNDNPALPGKPYVLFGKKGGDGRYQIHTFPLDAVAVRERELFLQEGKGEPLLVMTTSGDLPITGDYDLFAVCPSWDSYAHDVPSPARHRRLPVPERDHQRHQRPPSVLHESVQRRLLPAAQPLVADAVAARRLRREGAADAHPHRQDDVGPLGIHAATGPRLRYGRAACACVRHSF